MWPTEATPTAGYNLPYSTSYMSMVYIAAKANPVIAIVAAVTFLVNVIWLLTVALIMCQRAMFAWGMDRMGPRWFTSINHRFASPIGMYALVAGISAFMSIAYWYLFPSIASGLVATGMQLVSVFAVTAISAILLPYRKKVAHIWDASPYRRWKLLGVPVLTYAGVVYLAYVVVPHLLRLLRSQDASARLRASPARRVYPHGRRLGGRHRLVLRLEVQEHQGRGRCGSPDLRRSAARVTEGPRPTV